MRREAASLKNDLGQTDDPLLSFPALAVWPLPPKCLGTSCLKAYQLSEMKGGWFVGQFEPAILKSADFEAAVKYYRRGDQEPRHHHKIAEEITVIASGSVRMCGQIFHQGQIVCLAPGESTDFEALEDSITFVIKRPSVPGDKYPN